MKRPANPMPEDIAGCPARAGLRDAYDAPPWYQRNDYLGWCAGAKREATRAKRIEQMLDELRRGDTYMKMAWRPRRPSGSV